MADGDATALRWVARLFLAIGVGAAIGIAVSARDTLRFLDESVLTEGTVVDWRQGEGTADEPGAYYRIIEVVTSEGHRVRGEAETGGTASEIDIGERLAVRYRATEPGRMRVVSVTGLWLTEIVLTILAISFGAAGLTLRRQASAKR